MTGGPPGSPSSRARARLWSPGWTRCGSCCASRSRCRPARMPSSASPWVAKPRPEEAATRLAWRDPWPDLVGDSAAYGPHEHPASGRRWRELIVPRADLLEALGDRPLAGTWAAEALRVADWRPRLGFETDHRTIPHEVDWLRTAVHLHKGCYRGQETIARVHNLGRPPRRLVFLHLDGSGHVLPDSRGDGGPGRACRRPRDQRRASLRGRPDRARPGQAQHPPRRRPRRGRDGSVPDRRRRSVAPSAMTAGALATRAGGGAMMSL